MDVFSTIGHKGFDSYSGSLWRTLLFKPKSLNNFEDGKLVHKSTLLMNFNHAITDGFSNLLIFDLFIKILNKVIQDEEVDDTNNLVFSPAAETLPYFTSIKDNLFSDKQQLANCLEKYEKILTNTCNLFSQKIIHRNADSSKADLIVNEIGEKETSNFLKKCKIENVTVNSAFISLINLSILETLRVNKLIGENSGWEIPSGQVENLRKYYSDDRKNSIGCQVSAGFFKIYTDKDDLQDFWEYTRKVQREFKDYCNSGEMIRFEIARMLLQLQNKIPNADFKTQNKVATYYGLTNMGDASKVLKNKEKSVKILNILRYSSVYNTSYPLGYFIQTFEKRFTYTIVFNTQHIDKNLVHDIDKKTKEIFKNISN